MKALIIDPNPKTLATLHELLEGMIGTGNVFKAVQPYLFRSLLATEKIDVVFIRVRLWDFRAFQHIDRGSKMPAIVFVSGGKDKLTNKDESAVPYFLREPFHKFDLERLIKKIITAPIIEETDYFFLRYDGRFHRIWYKDIELIEKKEGSYVQFFFKYFSKLLPGTIAHWIRQLPEDQFVRIADNLIVPSSETISIKAASYCYKGREIPLTFRFAARARKEMEEMASYHLE